MGRLFKGLLGVLVLISAAIMFSAGQPLLGLVVWLLSMVLIYAAIKNL